MSDFADIEPTRVEVRAVLAAQVPAKSGPDPASIGDAMRAAFASLLAAIQQHRLFPSGPPRTIYTAYSPAGTSLIVAMPILPPPDDFPSDSALTISHLPPARTVRFLHRGPYRYMSQTYARIAQWMKQQALLQTRADWARYMPMWEEYQNSPQTTPDQALRTYIYLPLP